MKRFIAVVMAVMIGFMGAIVSAPAASAATYRGMTADVNIIEDGNDQDLIVRVRMQNRTGKGQQTVGVMVYSDGKQLFRAFVSAGGRPTKTKPAQVFEYRISKPRKRSGGSYAPVPYNVRATVTYQSSMLDADSFNGTVKWFGSGGGGKFRR